MAGVGWRDSGTHRRVLDLRGAFPVTSSFKQTALAVRRCPLSQHADVRQVAGEVGGWKLAGGHTESSDEAKPPSLLLASQNQAQPVVPEALRP